jgi:phosphoglucomutase
LQIPSKKEYLLTFSGATLVVSGDGRYYSEQAIQVKALYVL